jgi:hypothetical protein
VAGQEWEFDNLRKLPGESSRPKKLECSLVTAIKHTELSAGTDNIDISCIQVEGDIYIGGVGGREVREGM